MTVTAWQAPVYSLGYICSMDRAILQRELSSTTTLDMNRVHASHERRCRAVAACMSTPVNGPQANAAYAVHAAPLYVRHGEKCDCY